MNKRAQDLYLPTVGMVEKFRAAVLARDEQELHAYRAYACSIYDQLVQNVPCDQHMSDQIWADVVMDEMRIPTSQLDAGVILYDIRTFITQYPALAQKYLFQATTDYWRERAPCAFIEAYWNVGAVIFVPPSVHTDAPLDIHALLEPYRSGIVIEKCMIIIESHAQVTILDTVDMRSESSPVMLRAIDYHIGDYASVTIQAVSMFDAAMREAMRHTIHAGTKSDVHFIACMTGSANSTLWLDCIPKGRGAQLKVRGLAVLGPDQSIKCISTQHHAVVGGVSDVLIKSCLSGASIFDYQGVLRITHDAPRTNARQRNINLLLSDGARAHSLPSLEVVHNDVTCSHGSAVGRLDAQQLFYLQSRGFTLHQAREVLIHGFLSDIIDEMVAIDRTALRDSMGALIMEDNVEEI